ncbi:MAG: WXG100 family type VII secretion target [Bacillota bacterium]
MSKILVTPELLFRVANEFHTASIQLEWTINLLNQQISTMLVWDGTTRQRFFEDFHRARNEMTLTIEHMKVISEELKQIAIKFILIDDKSNPLYRPRYSDFKPFVSGEETEPKTWQDYAEELWEGAKSGGKILVDSVSDTVESLIEDPLGTGGQMLYNATIGTVEEVIDTAVWGTKMVFDVGDTREKFDEKINETGGMANYLGEQGALFAGGVLLRRVGVKNRHDSGGGGGRLLKKDEGTPKVPTNFKWGNPKSAPTYGHTFSEHGAKKKLTQLIDRARGKGHQISQWLDEKSAADFLAEVAKKGPGVHEVTLPSSIRSRGYLPDGTEIKPDMARVIVKEDGGIRSAFPYSSAHPSGIGQQ